MQVHHSSNQMVMRVMPTVRLVKIPAEQQRLTCVQALHVQAEDGQECI